MPYSKKKQSREERLEKKRIAERKRKEKIRNDAEKLELLRKTERERYHLKKQQKKILLLNELPIRKRRQIQRKKKIYNKEYYKRKTALKLKAHNAPNSNTGTAKQLPTISCAGPEGDNINVETSSFHRGSVSPRPNYDGLTRSRNLRSPDPCASSSHPKSLASMRSYARNRPNSPIASTSRVNQMNTLLTSTPIQSPPATPPSLPCESSLANSPSSTCSINSCTLKINELRNKLRLYQKRKAKDVMTLQKRIVELNKEKNVYQKRIARSQSTLNSKKVPEKNNAVEEKQLNKVKKIDTTNKRLRNLVIKFYEDDENSRICPGKKDCVTKNKLKKQKRYLTDTQKNLHSKFMTKGYPPISYTTFCRMRPFWIKKPNVTARETCVCQIHANMELITTALKKQKIISENSTTDLIKSMCCAKNDYTDCLLRKCSHCENKTILYKEFDNSNRITYWVWEKCSKTYVKDNIEKTANVVKKVQHQVRPLEAIAFFEKSLGSFLKHCGNIKNQYDAIKEVKKNLTHKECIVHMDFSENYCAKYSSEVQSVHFGGSRQQFTLHTAVIYSRPKDQTNLNSQAFCSVSASLRHDASAVWAHLIPILTEIENNFSEISTLHIISDSPSAQYRNRKIFYIITQLFTYCSKVSNVVWHYCECGHGKGAPDGVGGVLKRTADQLVAYGTDITDIETLIQALKASTKAVKIVRVEDYEIVEKDWLIPDKLNSFPGTMKVHQAVWSKTNSSRVALRSLSCVKPQCLKSSLQCPHGKHLGFYSTLQEVKILGVKRFKATDPFILPLAKNKTSRNKKTVQVAKSDISQIQITSLSSSLLSNYKIYSENDSNSDEERAVVPTQSFFESIPTEMFVNLEKTTDYSAHVSDDDYAKKAIKKPKKFRFFDDNLSTDSE